MERVTGKLRPIKATDDVRELVEDLNSLLSHMFGDSFNIAGNCMVDNAIYLRGGMLHLKERASDPADPEANMMVIWLNTSGELCAKYNDGSHVKSGVIAY